MNTLEVEIVSNEIIKPSSPTPETLRRYKLSFLDQLSPKAYSPFIYFYTSHNPNASHNHIAEISYKLKKSLSQALTLYYPLARRLKDDQYLDCNDAGALYVEARVKAKLSGVVENPIPSELNKLLPFELDELADFPLGVELNTFDCGGIAVGVCVSHRLGDALSSLVFVQIWTEIARGETDSVRPEFVAGDLFPAIDVQGYDPSFGITKGMCHVNVTKRFVFESPKIESLRAKYRERITSTQKPDRVSRVEALSTFIWTRFVNATKLLETRPEKDYTILHAVNVRPRSDPPLPSHSFGNYYTTSATTGSIASTAEEDYCRGLARKLREEIRKLDKGFVEYIRVKSDEFLGLVEKSSERFARGDEVVFVFSSLCRFPLHEADFGFGEPTWVSSAPRGFPNAVAFFDNKMGDGIEAYICLSREDMAKLEADQEFLAFVSPIFAALTN